MPFLTTPRLILRDYQEQDWERVHIYGSVAEFSQFEAWGPNTVADTKNFVNGVAAQANDPARFKFDFAICLREENLLIGGCTLGRESQDSAVAFIGWAINPEFQRQGFATEAARQLIEFGFKQLGLTVIYATCDSRNRASAAVMEKLGMKRVGLLRNHKTLKGVMRDTLRYELFR